MFYQKNLNLDVGANRQTWLVYKSTENHKIFIVTLTETLVCWVIRSWVIQVYTIHKSSQLLSVWSISAYIQYIFKKYNYFSSNWLRSKFSHIYMLIEGSSQTFLVTSQFFRFFAEMADISAERHLSKNNF